MKKQYAVLSRSHLSCSAAALLVALLSTGCGGEGVGNDSVADPADEAASTAGDEAEVEALELETLGLGLHAAGGVPLLSFRGAPPAANQQNSNQSGLNVAYRFSIGVNNSLVTALEVCWYTPSNANNIFTAGDPFGCTTLGNSAGASFTTQVCGTNEVVSGYRVGLSRDGSRIAKLATRCRSLTNPNTTRDFGFVGDSGILFHDTLDCTTTLGQTAYLEFISANPNFTGFSGGCVLP